LEESVFLTFWRIFKDIRNLRSMNNLEDKAKSKDRDYSVDF